MTASAKHRPASIWQPCFPAICLCLPWLAFSASLANGAEPPSPPELYEVELIVFRHADQTRTTPESPTVSSIFEPPPLELTLPELPVLPGSGAVQAGGPLTIDADERPRLAPIEFHLLELEPVHPDFVPLRPGQHQLDRAYERLARIDAYEPLLHLGWIQPARNTGDTRPFRIEPDVAGRSGITGSVSLFKERYLHIEMDLSLTAEPAPGKTPFFFGWGTDETPQPHRLSESRRIIGTATHYFDGPYFGVIARIQEVRTAAAARDKNGG